MQETPLAWSLRWEDPLKEGMANLSSTLALENPMDRGDWQATVHRVAQSWTWLKWLNTDVQDINYQIKKKLKVFENINENFDTT